LPGLESVGPLKVTDTISNESLDLSKGEIMIEKKIGLGMTLNESKLKKYALNR
jgi:hypothetical protein